MKEKGESRPKGVSAISSFAIAAVILTVLLLIIVILIYEVNRSSTELTNQLQSSAAYEADVRDFLAGTNTLSETASGYAQTPVLADGSANEGPLRAYAEELGENRHGPEIVERFREYAVSEAARNQIRDAAGYSEEMRQIQLHVIALLSSVYPLSDNPKLAALPLVELTPEEQAMPAEARVGMAKQLILGGDYAQLRYHVNDSAEACLSILKEDFDLVSENNQNHVHVLRTWLWIVVTVVILLISASLVLMCRSLIIPIRVAAIKLTKDMPVNYRGHLREAHVLADAYNKLLERREKLEDNLRSAAETDALTGLPNRYSFDRFDLDADNMNGSLGVLMFDVNFLKTVNDTQGHLAGDMLIRTAGKCIRECFGKGDSCENCFRIGGDEFAAVLTDCCREDLTTLVDRFEKVLEREQISVSVGWAYTDTMDNKRFKDLIGEADERMYDQKKIIHQRHGA